GDLTGTKRVFSARWEIAGAGRITIGGLIAVILGLPMLLSGQVKCPLGSQVKNPNRDLIGAFR
ncbi:MAG: hypothetical protein VX254_05060, partial [Planctomycetota bacterium]|nr:hypothetical protein [Planctomycetota bacterium]